MTTEQMLIEALKETIKTQRELIDRLKAEVESAKTSRPVINPFQGPSNPAPSAPIAPHLNPNVPYIPNQIINPLLPPYTVTCETGQNRTDLEVLKTLTSGCTNTSDLSLNAG